MSAVRIDPLAQVAEVGGRTYRLRLDIRAEAALVTVDDREYRVRLLQWREKAMLARFATLGEELVVRELVRACTDVDDPPPVLREVAVWINDPARGGANVPFDNRSLAAVTLQLCRATNLRPADFDGRAAAEVEEMWQALSSTSQEHASANQIVIVPDDRSADGSAGLRPADAAASSPPPSVGGRNGGETPALQQQTQRETHPAFRVNAQPAHTTTTAINNTQSGGETPALPQQTQRETRPAFRVNTQPAHTTTTAINNTPSGGETPALQQQTRRETHPTFRVNTQPAHTTTTAIEDTQSNGGTPALQAQPTLRVDTRVNDTRSAGVPPAGPAASSPPLRAQMPNLDFFDELADRLAEAAADMGIAEA
jgi:hypothetical protein